MTLPRTSFITTPLKAPQPRSSRGVSKAVNDGEPLIQRQSPTITPDRLSYEDAYERNVWVFRSILAIATNLGQVPLKVKKSTDGENFEDATDDKSKAALALLNQPNSTMRGNDLIENIAIMKNVRQALLWMSWGKPTDGPRTKEEFKAGKPPQNLYLLPAHKVIAKLVNNVLVGWDIRETSTFIPACQVIQFANFNPRYPYRGLPPTNPSFQSADTDYALEIHHANFFENGAKLSGLIGLDQSVTDERLTRNQAALDAVTGVGNAHTFLMLDGGAKFTSFMSDIKDMDFKNLSEKQRDKIAAAFGVGRFIFGDPIDANKATAKEIRKLFWMDVILPLMKDIEDGLTLNYLQPFFDKNLYFKFDISQVDALSESRDDFSTALYAFAQGVDLLIKNNVIDAQESRDVAREQFGLNVPEKIPAKPVTPPSDPNAPPPTAPPAEPAPADGAKP